MLGISISESTVSRYLNRLRRRPPSQTWLTFIRNHMHQSIAVDFMVVPTIRFSLLYVFVVLDHGRRRILHVAVTAHPTARWTPQQLTNALPWESDARFIHRDRDEIFGAEFLERVDVLELSEVVSARASPWQNGYCERVIGSIRRECTDHVIAINECQLQRVIDAYVDYYNSTRTHLSLTKRTPDDNRRPTAKRGRIIALPKVGGLHHRYDRIAA
jgi:transposase InsO family protein